MFPGIKEEDNKDCAGGFYRAIHLDVTLPPAQLRSTELNIMNTGCEIQVTSLLAHAANEIEHDLLDKPLTGEPSAEEMDLRTDSGALTVAGDKIINQLGLGRSVGGKRRTRRRSRINTISLFECGGCLNCLVLR